MADLAKQSKFPRVDFKPEDFAKLIQDKGYKVTWWRGMTCPCLDQRSKQPDPACPLCDHTVGFYYYEEKTVRAVCSSLTSKDAMEYFSQHLMGSAYITFRMDEVMPGWYDKIIMNNSLALFSEQIIKKATDTTHRLYYPPAISDESDHGMLKVINKDGTEYEEGVDYKIDGNLFTWLTGTTAEKYFALLYEYHPEYIVIDLPHEIRNTYLKKKLKAEKFQKMPTQVIARKKHLLGPENSE